MLLVNGRPPRRHLDQRELPLCFCPIPPKPPRVPSLPVCLVQRVCVCLPHIGWRHDESVICLLELGLADMEVVPVLSGERHIGDTAAMSFDPEYLVLGLDFIRIDTLLLQRQLVLLVVMGRRWLCDMSQEQRYCIFRQMGTGVPGDRHQFCTNAITWPLRSQLRDPGFCGLTARSPGGQTTS